MKLQQSSTIAMLFSVLALATSSILILNVPSWLRWVFAIFWFGTGLLGLYIALRSRMK